MKSRNLNSFRYLDGWRVPGQVILRQEGKVSHTSPDKVLKTRSLHAGLTRACTVKAWKRWLGIIIQSQFFGVSSVYHWPRGPRQFTMAAALSVLRLPVPALEFPTCRPQLRQHHSQSQPHLAPSYTPTIRLRPPGTGILPQRHTKTNIAPHASLQRPPRCLR